MDNRCEIVTTINADIATRRDLGNVQLSPIGDDFDIADRINQVDIGVRHKSHVSDGVNAIDIQVTDVEHHILHAVLGGYIQSGCADLSRDRIIVAQYQPDHVHVHVTGCEDARTVDRHNPTNVHMDVPTAGRIQAGISTRMIDRQVPTRGHGNVAGDAVCAPRQTANVVQCHVIPGT